MHYIDRMSLPYRLQWSSSASVLVNGGLNTEYSFLSCYVGYSVEEYLLGDGPSALTVTYAKVDERPSYGLYSRSYDIGVIPSSSKLSEGEFAAAVQEKAQDAESWLSSIVSHRESVVMLAPMGAHGSIAVETWQAIEQWDLQEDDDEVVQAVRYGVPEGDPEHTQTLANLKTRITTAAAADDFADDRIENVSGLQQYYRDIGAYGDITPDDGSTATFTPAQPPAAYSCASGTAVTTPGENLGLVHDCENLFDGKDGLRGTGTLNWSASTAIGSWDGVTTAGTPTRVTKVELDDEDLTGTVPAGLGSLFALTHLDLSDNSLTGSIPAELGWLHNLEEVRLSGNSLTGCIPLALRDVATNDLASLTLPYCRPPAPGAPTAGTVGETSVPLSWTTAANTSTYRVEYREGDFGYWEEDDVSITTTAHTVNALLCETDYEFRLSAYGDGTTYAGAWSDPSATLTATTGPCVPPVFGRPYYSFPIAADAAVAAAVGTVSATDDSGEPVTYAITAGNDEGEFAIDAESGAITLVGSLSGEAGTTVTLTVEARDAAGGAAEVPVTVTITGTCDSGTAVPNPSANPGLVSDCRTLLGLQSALAGTGALNWSAGTGMRSWDGVTLGGTPQRVAVLSLDQAGLTGTLPPELGRLTGLELLRLSANQLTGRIPREIGALTNLRDLWLNDNRLTGAIPVELGSLPRLGLAYLEGNSLTGSIPPELGNLTDLQRLWLFDNDLTGSIPSELGGLTELTNLWLSGNGLSGTIPAELTNLTNLNLLLLSGNEIEGCVPPSLRRIEAHDLADLGLRDCQEGPSAPAGVGATLTDGVFQVTWTGLSGVDAYEVQWRIAGAGDPWAALQTVTAASSADYAPAGGPACSSSYEFRVRAHGDGYTHATHWGPESAPEAVETPSCPPVFEEDPYSFETAEDAAVAHVAGTVSATDPDEGDILTYAITEGNEAGHFAIDGGTGVITVAGDLDYEMTTNYTLTVEAGDGRGGTDTTTVTVTVTDVAEDPPLAPENLNVTLTDGVFSMVWGTVPGTAKYEAQWRVRDEKAWIALEERDETSQTYTPEETPVCGTTYQFRVRAYGDGVTYAMVWGDASEVESLTTMACNLPPAFDDAPYTFSVLEEATIGASVGMVSATDPDEGDILTYAITEGNEAGRFAIDPNSGAVTVAAALDYEATVRYILTVEADDGRGETGTATVTVTVTDVVWEGELELWSGVMTAGDFILGYASASGYTSGVTILDVATEGGPGYAGRHHLRLRQRDLHHRVGGLHRAARHRRGGLHHRPR